MLNQAYNAVLASIMPVSYTHLDVYKRQYLVSLASSEHIHVAWHFWGTGVQTNVRNGKAHDLFPRVAK